MKATVEYVERKFREFNESYFSGGLKEIPIALSNAKTFQGMLTYKKRKLLSGKWYFHDFKMLINTRIDVEEAELEDTILHEMIHYYIYSNQFQDTSSHGQLFRKIMNSINQNFGRHITISKKLTKAEHEQLINSRPAKHVFAIVTLDNGNKYVKVVPRIRERIFQVHQNFLKYFRVKEIKWYYAENTYLNRFPSSVAMKLYSFDEQQMQAVIADAYPIDIKSL